MHRLLTHVISRFEIDVGDVELNLGLSGCGVKATQSMQRQGMYAILRGCGVKIQRRHNLVSTGEA